MRSTLLALACLSTFAMAQNVLAIAPLPGLESNPTLSPVEPASEFKATPSPSAVDARQPAALSLLVIGLAGLTIAGGRREGASEVDPAEA